MKGVGGGLIRRLNIQGRMSGRRMWLFFTVSRIKKIIKKKKMKTVSADETEIASAHQNVSALLPQTG